MSNLLYENKTLRSFYDVLPYLPNVFEEDVSFALTDRHKYLKIQNGRDLKLSSAEGSEIPTGGVIIEALRTGKTQIKVVPKEVYGITFKSFAIPIRDGNNIIGIFAVGKSLATKEAVMSISKNLSSALSQISTTINDISSGLKETVNMASQLLSNAQEANEKSKETDQIINFIQGISTETNLLGLNASIEAARAGDFGKGFNVVAQEIRKLSNSSNESIKKIDSLIRYLSTSINSITDKISESNNTFISQAAALEHMAAYIQELNSTAQILEGLAYKL